MKNKRVYHRFEKCEEFKSNMWKSIKPIERETYIDDAKSLMINVNEFYNAMIEVINLWPISCECNLTSTGINHQAWIGRAACAIAVDCPEDMTRLAWRTLTKEQQNEANQVADKAISVWSKAYYAKA